jgi:hypothetical protein
MLTCIWKMFGVNLYQDADSEGFYGFPQAIQANCWDDISVHD